MEETWAQVQGKMLFAEQPSHGWKYQTSIFHDTSRTRSAPHLQRATCRKETAKRNHTIDANLIWVSMEERCWNRGKWSCSEYLHHGIIKSDASWRCFWQNASPECFVVGEGVDDKGFGPWVYDFNAFLYVFQLHKQRLSSLENRPSEIKHCSGESAGFLLWLLEAMGRRFLQSWSRHPVEDLTG